MWERIDTEKRLALLESMYKQLENGDVLPWILRCKKSRSTQSLLHPLRGQLVTQKKIMSFNTAFEYSYIKSVFNLVMTSLLCI